MMSDFEGNSPCTKGLTYLRGGHRLCFAVSGRDEAVFPAADLVMWFLYGRFVGLQRVYPLEARFTWLISAG